MGGFLFFVLLAGGLVLLLRYLRRREVEAFRRGDNTRLKELDIQPELPTPVVPLAPSRATEGYVARERLLDDVHSRFLHLISDVAGQQYHVFVRVPLKDFVKSGSPVPALRITFLLCRRKDSSIVCGVLLRSAGPTELETRERLKQVFAQINLPLVEFPMVQDISAAEITEGLGAYL